jgi:hypothetical protein
VQDRTDAARRMTRAPIRVHPRAAAGAEPETVSRP